ncbi:serine/threonine-protein kinase [Streptomyces virginiae]|uniref:serine/threonine-protein kinase n=1 Tax=Streptomyces virginiae TaxID=1961 RepID=UPI0038254ECE
MGIVWRAHDEQLDREVALKELRLPDDLDASGREAWIGRLDREARAAARLKHPGVITVHDRIAGDDGRPWIVMELVHGRSLDDLIKDEGPLPPARVAGIGLQVPDALRAVHATGVTHRDIKPANVLLEGARVVLTDFGIAAVEGEPGLTRSGALMGTPVYMAPEQVRGSRRPPSPTCGPWARHCSPPWRGTRRSAAPDPGPSSSPWPPRSPPPQSVPGSSAPY